MKWLAKRKLKQIQKIFPNSIITFDSKLYFVQIEGLKVDGQQTKQLEKKRLRIDSIEIGQVVLRRKLKVFDWFLIYGSLRITIGVLMVMFGLILL